ncbi:universal stress protein [Dactylosporangium roseum]|uniref:universal stress protein n=1 Tax=Dactylosporangium roseum TaxID=47989 RepID=UPI0021B17AD6|nr:universal stress protein [Dactylosporangium roseum]
MRVDFTGIVVGSDGSASSDEAVRWAAAEAVRAGVPLRVVVAYHWRWPGRPARAEELDRFAREHAETMVARSVTVARQAEPAVAVDGVAVMGVPADVLLTSAAKAAMLVVGAKSDHGFAAALLGSVAFEVATYATCPVTVVRGRADGATGPVIAAVDGSAAAEGVLATGFEQAARRGCDLLALRVHPPEAPVAAELAASLAPWRARHPAVRAQSRLVDGHPAQVLVEASRDARLVVVGHRGHGGFAGLLLGSVGQALLHHAGCPVLVLRGAPPR